MRCDRLLSQRRFSGSVRDPRPRLRRPGLPTATGLGLGGAQARLARGPGRSCPHPLRYRLRATDKTKSGGGTEKGCRSGISQLRHKSSSPGPTEIPNPTPASAYPDGLNRSSCVYLATTTLPFCSDGRRRQMPAPTRAGLYRRIPRRRANRPDARPPESLAETARPASTGSQRRSLCSRATLGGQLALCHDLDRQCQPGRAIAFGQIRVLHGRRLRRCMSAALHR